MRAITISPSSCQGTLVAPASKSAVQRAMALALLHNGKTIIKSAGHSEDEMVARRIIKLLGAKIETAGDAECVFSKGNIKPLDTSLDFSESGLSFRMFTPIVSLSPQKFILTGSGTLLRRPMHFFLDVLPEMQVAVFSKDGFPPFEVQGPLIAHSITISGEQSSQYLTGMLFALAKAANERVEIFVHNLKSKPYIDLSIQMLLHFGYSVSHSGYEKFIIEPGNLAPETIIYNAEGDWSGASFFLVAGAIGGNVTISNLRRESLQADQKIVQVLESVGAQISWNGAILKCAKADLMPFEFDATDCPDLFPPLAALAANCKGESVLIGRSRLVSKESNREKSIIDILSKMGVPVKTEKDSMWIMGGGGIQAAKVSSHHDHRIAMMASILALNANDAVEIEGADSVRKSYPGFFSDLQNLAVKMNIHE